MKKLLTLFSSSVLLLAASTTHAEDQLKHDVTSEIPEISVPEKKGFQKIANVAQYGHADWSNVVGIARNISLSEAYQIANDDPSIDFFFYTKGYQMVLGTGDGNYRVFRHGDTVFFSGTPWWGSANDLADGYIKQKSGS